MTETTTEDSLSDGAAVLIQLVDRHAGDLTAAVEEWAGVSVGVLAGRLGLPRQTVGQALRQSEGRGYAHVFRALEAEFGLRPYEMNAVRRRG